MVCVLLDTSWTLRVELKRYGIRTIVIEPGVIQSTIHDKATQHVEALPAEVREPFAEQYRRLVLNQGHNASAGAPARAVSERVVDALQLKRPAPRYGAGKDARLLRGIHWLLSDRLRDVMLTRMGRW